MDMQCKYQQADTKRTRTITETRRSKKAYTGLPVVRVTKTEGTELGGIELQGSS